MPLDEPDEPDEVEPLDGVDVLDESDEPVDFDDESPPDFVGDSADEAGESVPSEEPPDEPELAPLRLSVL